MDNTKVHPGPLLWSGFDVWSAVSWWLAFLLTLSVITRPRTHYPAQSSLMAESATTCRQEQTRAMGKQVECQLSSQYFSDCGMFY